MFISKDSKNKIDFNIRNAVVYPSSMLNILGVRFDKHLTFDEHINILSSNVARQPNTNLTYCHILITILLFDIFVQYKIQKSEQNSGKS